MAYPLQLLPKNKTTPQNASERLTRHMLLDVDNIAYILTPYAIKRHMFVCVRICSIAQTQTQTNISHILKQTCMMQRKHMKQTCIVQPDLLAPKCEDSIFSIY